MKKILLIGSGAREHALARAIKKSTQECELYCFSNSTNPGIKLLTKIYQLGDLANIKLIGDFAVTHKIDFAVIGPEGPLELGVADVLWANNIAVIGPKKSLAMIETSKKFTRDLLKKYNISGNPEYQYFNNLNANLKEIEAYLEKLKNNYVIKADGLMGGKGVKVFGEHLNSDQEAIEFCQELINKKQSFVIERKHAGPEFSLISFSDGKNLIHMPLVQDHKRAYEDDTGPNTGGMGSVSFESHALPFVSKENLAAAQEINQKSIEALYQETGEYYIGFLYGGYMLTQQGVVLIEFNARLGDPEAINLLCLLESDFVSHCEAMINGCLDTEKVNFAPKATVCKYAVPHGYPDNPVKNKKIDVGKVSNLENLFLAAVEELDGELIATGSRAVAVLGMADNIRQAEQQAQNDIEKIEGDLFYRKDIGTQNLINKKMNLLCEK